MRYTLHTTLAVAGPIAAASLLAACAGHDRASPVSAKQPAAVVRTSSAGSSLWRLRSGLNVAALTCRGRSREAVAPAYRKMLTRHRLLLDATYKAEVSRRGMAFFDHEQTRVYNRFANQRSPEDFCRTAVHVATEANAMDSSNLSPAASRLLALLERGLR